MGPLRSSLQASEALQLLCSGVAGGLSVAQFDVRGQRLRRNSPPSCSGTKVGTAHVLNPLKKAWRCLMRPLRSSLHVSEALQLLCCAVDRGLSRRCAGDAAAKLNTKPSPEAEAVLHTSFLFQKIWRCIWRPLRSSLHLSEALQPRRDAAVGGRRAVALTAKLNTKAAIARSSAASPSQHHHHPTVSNAPPSLELWRGAWARSGSTDLLPSLLPP